MNIHNLIEDTAGASAIEYGLLAALIGVGMVAAVSSTGTTLNNTMTNVETCLDHSSGSCTIAGGVAVSNGGEGASSSSAGGAAGSSSSSSGGGSSSSSGGSSSSSSGGSSSSSGGPSGKNSDGADTNSGNGDSGSSGRRIVTGTEGGRRRTR